ncbi:MAG: PQQ-binding-like beta-propeller repeat protein [Chryseolinea sp.]
MPLFSKRFLSGIVLFIVTITLWSCGKTVDKERVWSVYKADAQSSSYAELNAINKTNVRDLQIAWTFRPDDARGNRIGNSECNPIIVDGIMYVTSARHRLYAIDAITGERRWSHDAFDGGEGGGIYRGVTYWEDGSDKRILYTAGDQLYALEASTGKAITTFGDGGKVSMNDGLRGDPKLISVRPTSPGVVFKDLIIMGAEVSELYGAEPGYIRAYNVRTGKLEWTFHTIPHPGEKGYETWPKDAWKYVGGVNDWSGMSVDHERGLVFLALGSPSYDFYGADRHGQNLFGNSIVALDAATGQYRWHFQTVHHDLWDYDLPAPPNLITIERNGKKVDAVAQTTKTGFLFVLNRDTGEPVFPVEERPVPPSYVPGEKAWPTQPFPVQLLPYSRQHMTEEDLTAYTPAAHDSLVKKFRSLRYEGMYTPPDIRGTLMIPGTRGGSNWGGAAFDKETGLLYIKSNDSPEIDILQRVEKSENDEATTPYFRGKAIFNTYCATCHGRDRRGDPPNYPSLADLAKRMPVDVARTIVEKGKSRMPAFGGILNARVEDVIAFLYENKGRPSQKEADIFEIHSNLEGQSGKVNDTATVYLNITPFSHFNDIDGHPAIKPPWGALNAINLNTGEYAWKKVIGNIPELQLDSTSITGAEGYGGPIVTSGGLVFIAGTRDKMFRAFDKDNGDLLWETKLPAIGNATPCTYWSGGRQFVALSVTGTEEDPAGYVISFALPAD